MKYKTDYLQRYEAIKPIIIEIAEGIKGKIAKGISQAVEIYCDYDNEKDKDNLSKSICSSLMVYENQDEINLSCIGFGLYEGLCTIYNKTIHDVIEHENKELINLEYENERLNKELLYQIRLKEEAELRLCEIDVLKKKVDELKHKCFLYKLRYGRL